MRENIKDIKIINFLSVPHNRRMQYMSQSVFYVCSFCEAMADNLNKMVWTEEKTNFYQMFYYNSFCSEDCVNLALLRRSLS